VADLAALLDREATAEIEEILSEARSRASEIIAAAEEEANALLSSRRRTAESQREAALVRARSAAQLEASSLTLRAQHKAIEDVFEEVERQIDEVVAKPGFSDIFARLLDEAVRSGGIPADQIESVSVNPSHVELAREQVAKAGLSADVVGDPAVRGGVRVRSRSNVVVENTLYERLEALQGDLASEVAQVLLSKEG